MADVYVDARVLVDRSLLLERLVVEKLFDQVNVGQQHTTAAVTAEVQGVQSVTEKTQWDITQRNVGNVLSACCYETSMQVARYMHTILPRRYIDRQKEVRYSCLFVTKRTILS